MTKLSYVIDQVPGQVVGYMSGWGCFLNFGLISLFARFANFSNDGRAGFFIDRRSMGFAGRKLVEQEAQGAEWPAASATHHQPTCMGKDLRG